MKVRRRSNRLFRQLEGKLKSMARRRDEIRIWFRVHYAERVRKLSLIEIIDIAAVVELFDETEIDKVFSFCSLCFWVAR